MALNKRISFSDVEGKTFIFKGCTFDAGWEFDAPCILYAPFEAYDSSGTHVYNMIEDLCIDICIDQDVLSRFSKSDINEFKWRGWNPKGFKYRRNAHHEFYEVRFFINKECEQDFEMKEIKTKGGVCES